MKPKKSFWKKGWSQRSLTINCCRLILRALPTGAKLKDEETRSDLIPKPAHVPLLAVLKAIQEVLDGGGKKTIQPIASQRGKTSL